jgi:hypothetical protein
MPCTGPISEYVTWTNASQTALVTAVSAAVNVTGSGATGPQGPQGECCMGLHMPAKPVAVTAPIGAVTMPPATAQTGAHHVTGRL